MVRTDSEKSKEVPPRPQAPAIVVENIPDQLKEQPRWVGWEFKLTKDGNWTKVPKNPLTGGNADTTDLKTWSTFDEALAAYQTPGSRLDGIGFVLGDGFAGFDGDNCINPDTGDVLPWGLDLLHKMDTYSEVSPSLTGVKAFCRGTLPEGHRCKKNPYGTGRVEIYTTDRFFTVTGMRLDCLPATVGQRQTQLESVYTQVFGTSATKPIPKARKNLPPLDVDDDDLIRMACRAKNGDKFRRLWNGDTTLHNGDDSGADLALCNLLRFWTRGDVDRMDRLFRQSGLMRDKWDERHFANGQTYGQHTLELALDGEVYDPTLCRGAKVNFGSYKTPPHSNGDGHPPSGASGNESETAEDDSPDPIHLTDRGNGIRLVQRHGQDLRHCFPWRKWLTWDGKRWQADATAAATRKGKETLVNLFRWTESEIAHIRDQIKGEPDSGSE